MNTQKKNILAMLATILGVVVGGVGVGFLSYLLIAGWFGGSGPANIGSIEVSYLSMGRFLADYGFKTFAPFWYLGFPFHLFYTPLLPFLEWLLHSLGIGWWESYRLVTGIAFVLTPVAVFLTGWQWSKRFLGGIVAGVFYAVGPTLLYWLAPGGLIGQGEVALDRILLDFFEPRRFTVLVRWGEGPHTLSLLFVAFIGLFMSRYLERRRWSDLVAVAVCFGLASLSNAMGFFAGVMLIIVMGGVAFVQNIKPRVHWSLGILAVFLGLGVISFWYNWSFLTNFFGEGGTTFSFYKNIFPWGWLAAILGLMVIYWLVRFVVIDFGVATSLVWGGGLLFVVLTYYWSASVSESYRRIELLPQALRLSLEADMGIALLVGSFVGFLWRRIERRLSYFSMIGVGAAMGVLVGGFVYLMPMKEFFLRAGAVVVDLNQTRERQVAFSLEKYVDQKKGERVLAPGNYGFYLNFFSDIWQVRGALYQASTHPWAEHMYFQLMKGIDPAIALAWLEATNTRYLVVTTPASSELYKEIEHQERFADFEVMESDRGDIIYRVPLVNPSLVQVVDAMRMRSLAVPKKADDAAAILAYQQWIDSSQDPVDLTIVDNDTYAIRGKVAQEKAVLVQMTYDRGWRAWDASGRKLKTLKDPLGFLVLLPSEDTNEIHLTHGRIFYEWVGYITSAMVVGGIMVVGLMRKRKKQNSFLKTHAND